MSTSFGFVVVEFNQAGGSPRIYDEGISYTADDAQEVADLAADDAIGRGRGETYRVFELVEPETEAQR